MRRLPYEAKVPIFKRAGYRPNPDQIAIHKDTTDLAFVSGGWRGGKSVVAAAEALPHCLIPAPRAYLGALIGPTYKEPREEFDYLVEFLSTALPRHQFDATRHISRPNEGPSKLWIPAQKTSGGEVYFAEVRTYTAAEAESVRGFNAEWVVMCEAGGISESSFEAIIGRVLSTGGFIFGSGTLETSQKWYHNKIKTGLEGAAGHKSFIMPSWVNLAVFPEGRNDPKILRAEAILDPETFAVRIGAEPIRVSGVAMKQMKRELHVRPVEFNPSIPVELAIDPGYTGAYSVLAIQRYDNQVRIIDEVYEKFLGTREVAQICMQRPWWKNVDEDNPGVIDRAANQKQAVTGQSVLDVWFEETGLWFDYTQQIIPVDDGLDQFRFHLSVPEHIAISPRCYGLLAEADLGEFPPGFEAEEPWHYKQDRDGKFRGDQALTGADHSSTALIYWLIHRYGFMTMDDLLSLGFSPTRVLPYLGQLQIEDPDYGPEEGISMRTLHVTA